MRHLNIACLLFKYVDLTVEAFFNWNSLHARLNSHYKAWSYKKKKHKENKAYSKPLQKEPTFNMSLLILGLKPSNYRNRSIGREFHSLV